ncbi:hypothetical protein M427DRAFT_130602 [Gonapodya prolifera JEL478]|uniref:Uncharacterized protein n=1 Tax=Gonapodya prolifera (strain JEL478) TaxID=1344416 RepID=A0A139AYW3_GONPJ|nr:hypothetical protein M427DRAFT_130602 [Gonapodya prolifera JEL478]|eukprot:KXS21916.1 hypothetical protein M427DRAFT_130602 [Gonapodya prolifera JEL478]
MLLSKLSVIGDYVRSRVSTYLLNLRCHPFSLLARSLQLRLPLRHLCASGTRPPDSPPHASENSVSPGADLSLSLREGLEFGCNSGSVGYDVRRKGGRSCRECRGLTGEFLLNELKSDYTTYFHCNFCDSVNHLFIRTFFPSCVQRSWTIKMFSQMPRHLESVDINQ